MTKTRISSDSAVETQFGNSRAVVAGDWLFVSGTMGIDYAENSISEALVEQRKQGFETIAALLRQAHSSLLHVVRMMYVSRNDSDFGQCWLVLRRHFGDAPPSATLICAGLADSPMTIEIEVRR
jgi:enamine deaminase RidA (YjgF/YER057c/UK114 family)